jgi:hypothetical protein
MNSMKVGFDFYRYALISVEAKLDGLAMNKRQVKLRYYATVHSIFNDGFIPAKQLEFEELRIMNGFETIESSLEDAVKILREMIN